MSELVVIGLRGEGFKVSRSESQMGMAAFVVELIPSVFHVALHIT
jgi:hypothetical protein